MEKAVTPASSVAASAAVIAHPTESPNSSPSEPVVVDVEAAITAVLRASRRGRYRIGLQLNPADFESLRRAAQDQRNARAAGTDSSMQGGEHQQQSRALVNESSATQIPSGADPKLNVAKSSSKIPSNACALLGPPNAGEYIRGEHQPIEIVQFAGAVPGGH